MREHGAIQVVLPSLMGPEHNKLDALIQKHAAVVDSKIVPEILRWIDTGEYDKERVFKLLFRFYKVFRAYQSKKEGWSLARCKELWGKMQNVFLGDKTALSPGLGLFINVAGVMREGRDQ